MQVSIDGTVWTRTQRDCEHFKLDTEVRQFSIANAANVDRILLGAKLKLPIHIERFMAGYAGHLSLLVRCLIE
jgi:hypothetical protein